MVKKRRRSEGGGSGGEERGARGRTPLFLGGWLGEKVRVGRPAAYNSPHPTARVPGGRIGQATAMTGGGRVGRRGEGGR